MTSAPELTSLTGRAADIVVAARRVIQDEGVEALTMRRLATEVGMQAPSLYKHFSTKRAVETALIAQVLLEVGKVFHAAVAKPGRFGPVQNLLEAYRITAQASPAMYRLLTSGRFPREDLPPGLEDWAGQPFFLATGESSKAQALFSFAHGMVILELDERFPPGSELDSTWKAGAIAFAR